MTATQASAYPTVPMIAKLQCAHKHISALSNPVPLAQALLDLFLAILSLLIRLELIAAGEAAPAPAFAGNRRAILHTQTAMTTIFLSQGPFLSRVPRSNRHQPPAPRLTSPIDSTTPITPTTANPPPRPPADPPQPFARPQSHRPEPQSFARPNRYDIEMIEG